MALKGMITNDIDFTAYRKLLTTAICFLVRVCNKLHMAEKQVLSKILSVSLSDSEVLNLLGELKESDNELERECGISRKTIYNWKKGKVEEIRMETKEKLLTFILNKYGKEGLMMIAKEKRYSYVQILLELMRRGLSEEEKRKLEVIISADLLTALKG